MAYVKNIVCLANSIKIHPGRCIAGREVLANGSFGQWIRPISDRPTAEVSPGEFSCDGVPPKLLDIIAVPLLKAVPHDHQRENHLIDSLQKWKRIGAVPFGRLSELLETPMSLWTNNRAHDTIDGENNCLTSEEAAVQTYSLALIRPTECIAVVSRNQFNGRKRFWTRFRYRGVNYALSLTDPVVTDQLLTKDTGSRYPLENVGLCVSLAEPNPRDDLKRCSKLVAAIFSKDPLPLN